MGWEKVEGNPLLQYCDYTVNKSIKTITKFLPISNIRYKLKLMTKKVKGALNIQTFMFEIKTLKHVYTAPVLSVSEWSYSTKLAEKGAWLCIQIHSISLFSQMI